VYTVSVGVSGNNLNSDLFSGNGSTTAFTLSINAVNKANTQVFISGVYQQKGTYSVSNATLTFSEAPPSGTNNIEVMTFTQTEVNVPVDSTITSAKLSGDLVTPGALQVTGALTAASISGPLGASNPAAVAATTGVFSGMITKNNSPATLSQFMDVTGSTTSGAQGRIRNTAAILQVGIEGSAGGATLSGASAYSGFIGTTSNTDFHIHTNNVVRATTSASGHFGVGVVPSAYASGFGLDLATRGIGLFGGNDSGALSINAYFNSGWKYKGASVSKYPSRAIDGAFKWRSAPANAGAAGDAITWTDLMTLDPVGRLRLNAHTATANTTLSIKSVGNSDSQINSTDNAAVYANGATVDFPSRSGVVIVNSWTSGGVRIITCGAGAVTVVGGSGVVGTISYVAGLSGYRWTNDTGGTIEANFFWISTRTTA